MSQVSSIIHRLTLKVPDKLQFYGLYVYYVVHICDFGMLRVDRIVVWHKSILKLGQELNKFPIFIFFN